MLKLLWRKGLWVIFGKKSDLPEWWQNQYKSLIRIHYSMAHDLIYTIVNRDQKACNNKTGKYEQESNFE